LRWIQLAGLLRCDHLRAARANLARRSVSLEGAGASIAIRATDWKGFAIVRSGLSLLLSA